MHVPDMSPEPKAESCKRAYWLMQEPSAMYQSKEIPRIFDRDVKIPSESCEIGDSDMSGMSGMSGRICGSAGGAQDEVILFFLAPYYSCRDSRSQHAAGRSPIQSLACAKS